jgi:hypothetical protein
MFYNEESSIAASPNNIWYFIFCMARIFYRPTHALHTGIDQTITFDTNGAVELRNQ